MVGINRVALVSFLVSMGAGAAITEIVRQLYLGLGWVDKATKKDHPKNIHEKPVPRGGGIPILGAVLTTTLMFGSMNSKLVMIFLGGGVLMILGILDDKLNLNPYLRLGISLIISIGIVASGIRVSFISNPLGEGVINWGNNSIIAWLVSVVWILWGINFVNMGAKGLDGQLPGVAIIASVVIGILSLRFRNDSQIWNNVVLAFAVGGAYAGFLPFNMYPQKMMPGWGGGSLAGYFLAIMAIMGSSKVATALIVLGVPFVDVVGAMIRRILEGKSPVWGDDKHLHHYLLKLGWSKRRVAMFYWLITAILGGLALTLNSEGKMYLLVLTSIIGGGILLWLNYFISLKRSE